jgi:hypothetical protein
MAIVNTVVLPLAVYGPGTFTFVPALIPSTTVGYAIMISRALFTDPATSMLVWLDISLDAGVSWLGHPLENGIFDAVGLAFQAINSYSAVADRGNVSYPPLATKVNQFPGAQVGDPVPLFLNNPADQNLVATQGSLTRMVRGGAIVLGTVTTFVTVATY